jgi:hypothetical protein
VREDETRVLVALEDEYRVYRDMIAAATAVLRPQAEVESTGLDELGEQVRRFDPQVVVCSYPNTVEPGGRLAWVELSLDPTRPTKICVGGCYSELASPALEVLFEIIEETEKLVQTKRDRAGC